MNIKGLDYNTQREPLVMPEYGREVQKMVERAIGLPTKQERQRCAATIIDVMDRMTAQNRNTADHKQKLWDHLAIMSHFKLDIDYPYDISEAKKMASRPEAMAYSANRIPARHYGRMLFEVFEKLKTMPEGKNRDDLTRYAANQMKRCLIMWSHVSNTDERIADDLARYTDGAIQLDLKKFHFEKINERDLLTQPKTGKKRR